MTTLPEARAGSPLPPAEATAGVITFRNRLEVNAHLSRLLLRTSLYGLTTVSTPQRTEAVAAYFANGVDFEREDRLKYSLADFVSDDPTTIVQVAVDLLAQGSFFGDQEQLPQDIDNVTVRDRRRAIVLLEQLALFDEANLAKIANTINQSDEPLAYAAEALVENVQRWQRGASMQAW